MDNSTNSIRWKQRYNNYAAMLKILADSFSHNSVQEYSELEQIGLAKSFELSFALMWKLLKDYMEYEGVEIGLLSPKNVLKTAATCGLLVEIDADGDVLMAAHKSRNELMGICNGPVFDKILLDIGIHYLPQMQKLENFFASQG